eukprot:3369059-Amphidinium_carterae.1
MTKIQAHMRPEQAAGDTLLLRHMKGNESADKFAKLGAGLHGVTQRHLANWEAQEVRQTELAKLAMLQGTLLATHTWSRTGSTKHRTRKTWIPPEWMTDLAQWALAAPQEHARRLGSTATQ